MFTGGPVSYVERTDNLALGFSAVSEQNRPLGSRLKPTTKEPQVGREAEFPEFLCKGPNPRPGLQFWWSGSWPLEPRSCKLRHMGSDLGFVPLLG